MVNSKTKTTDFFLLNERSKNHSIFAIYRYSFDNLAVYGDFFQKLTCLLPKYLDK